MIKDFKDGYKFEGMLMVTGASRGVTNSGDAYINVTLQDSSGQIEGKKWKATEEDFNMFEPGNIISIVGDVYFYKTELQLKILSNSIAEGINVYDFLAQPVNRNELLETLVKFIGYIDNDEVKKVVETIISEIYTDFSFFPAASKNHHEYVSGLLHHTVTMLKIAKALVEIYPSIDKNYLYAGIILHDAMKTKELTGPAIPKYTLQGRLLGHISMGQANVSRVCEKLNISDEVSIVLQHLVLSHHGQRDFGSPMEPSTREAELIYLIDNIDSKLNMIDKALKDIPEGEFTSKINPLDNRCFYKPTKK